MPFENGVWIHFFLHHLTNERIKKVISGSESLFGENLFYNECPRAIQTYLS